MDVWPMLLHLRDSSGSSSRRVCERIDGRMGDVFPAEGLVLSDARQDTSSPHPLLSLDLLTSILPDRRPYGSDDEPERSDTDDDGPDDLYGQRCRTTGSSLVQLHPEVNLRKAHPRQNEGQPVQDAVSTSGPVR